jgi:hypothetical protein
MNKEDMIEGHIYLTKDLQEVMYLGKHMWYGTQYLSKVSSTNSWAGKLKYIFLPTSKIGISIRNINRYIDIWNNDHYIITSDYKKIASKISDDVSPEFANEYTKFKQCWRSSAPVKLVLSPININRIKKDEYFSHHGVFTEIYGETLCGSFWKKRYENNYLAEFDYKVKIHNESIMTYGHSQKPYVINDISIEDLQQKVFDCFVEFQNGSKIRLSEIV